MKNLMRTMKNKIAIVLFFLLAHFAPKAQITSVDTLKGFMCYHFGDTVTPRNARVRRVESGGRFIVYNIDSLVFCGLMPATLDLCYYEGKLYQIYLDFPGERETHEMLNVFTKAFGKYSDMEVTSTEYEIRAYYWRGKKVEIKYSTDGTYTASKVIISDKTVKDKMYNFPTNTRLNGEEENLLNKILGK
jgi:hypothetical protein